MILLKFNLENDGVANTIYIAIAAIVVIAYSVVQYRRKKREAENNQYTSIKVNTIGQKAELVETIANQINTPCIYVKFALGLPVFGRCKATTAEEAEECYTEADSDTDEEYFALVKWIELESDLERMVGLYGELEDHPDLQKQAREKWNTLALAEVASTETQEDLESLSELIYSSSEAEKQLIQKLHRLLK